MPSYYSIHFGCRANQADAAAIERDLAQRGFFAAGSGAQADVVVLNSCTVTASADSELRQTVRRIHRENPRARILVTGCYAQRRPEEIARLPGVEWVVGNSHKMEVASLLSESCAPAINNSGTFVPVTSLLAPGERRLDSDLRKLGSILIGDISSQRAFLSSPYLGGAVEDRTRPNLKIQDGCNNRCSFCIIPSVRGLSRSLPVEDVIRQIRALAESGYREVVLSGVNLGQYGRDLPGKPRFVRLVHSILDETPVERLRLSSVEPMDFTDKLLDLMAATPRIARHVHAPLQSGSDRILRRMHRKYRASQYRERILAAYDRMPDAAFGADVIVGFPGEMASDFEATRRLIEELPFTYLHVFPFSRRADTGRLYCPRHTGSDRQLLESAPARRAGAGQSMDRCENCFNRRRLSDC
jgi:threonylcarbamoyladenosine tRNA methylthiotransferase MtaB